MRTGRFGLAMMAVLFALHASAQQGPSGKVPPQLPSQASDKAKETVQARTAPTVSLTMPTAGTLYTAPAVMLLEASATASSGGRSISQVEFFAGAELIGAATTVPYMFNWNSVAAGTYSLTARATDNVGVASTSAPVSITVNALPTVSFESPGNNALFTAPAAITLTASAADSDGSIAQIEFFQGTSLVATVTSPPYSFNLTNVAAGNYVYSARATDDRGAAATSAPVTVRVNAPPSVDLTSPASNATFTAPATIPLSVLALDSDGTVARVEFYNGASLIGELTAPPFNTNWLLVPAGSYSLTAHVTDDLGATAVSEAVSVTVNQATAQIYYLHTDHLNTPRAIYNQQQQLVWRWDNTDPFGGNVPDENPSGLGNFTCNLRFPGQYFDGETNLHYNYFRDYDAEIGRYVQSDPIGMHGGVNTYVFVKSNPLNFSDFVGLSESSGSWWIANGSRYSDATRERIRVIDPYLLPAGNLWGDYKKQDWVCTQPVGVLNNTLCTQACCIEHDRCYEEFRCNASSWLVLFPTACQICNAKAARCMLSVVLSGSVFTGCKRDC